MKSDVFDDIFKGFDDVMSLFDKVMKSIDKKFMKSALKNGTKIRIKKGSIVYIGDGVYATLLQDSEAMSFNGDKLST